MDKLEVRALPFTLQPLSTHCELNRHGGTHSVYSLASLIHPAAPCRRRRSLTRFTQTGTWWVQLMDATCPLVGAAAERHG